MNNNINFKLKCLINTKYNIIVKLLSELAKLITVKH